MLPAGAAAGAAEILQVKVGGGEKEGALVKDALLAKFPDAGFRVLQEDDVGPQVGRELKRKAVWAMVWSLAAMIIYIPGVSSSASPWGPWWRCSTTF